MAERMAARTCWNLQDMKIPSEVLGRRVRVNARARRGAGEKPGSAFFFFPPLRQLHPGKLTFHTAGLSVSPRKPFPDENQSVEPSKLPDNPCGQHQGPVASTQLAARLMFETLMPLPSPGERNHLPSYLLSSIQLKVLHSQKQHSAHVLI